MRLPKDWPRIRQAALDKAGWKSARSGLHGRLECHHKDGDRSNNRPSNLEILTRAEHRREHYHPDPDREAWADFLRELNNA